MPSLDTDHDGQFDGKVGNICQERQEDLMEDPIMEVCASNDKNYEALYSQDDSMPTEFGANYFWYWTSIYHRNTLHHTISRKNTLLQKFRENVEHTEQQELCSQG